MALKLNNYLTFDGNCTEAMALYEKVFKVKMAYSCTYGQEESMSAMNLSDADKNKILHCYLPISEHTALMGADYVDGCGAPKVQRGNHISINISPDTEDEAKRIFAELSEGGNIIMPLEKTFWNALYGMFTDRFGINWMVNYNYEKCVD